MEETMGLEDRVDRTLANVRGLIQRVADAMGAGRDVSAFRRSA